MIHLVQRGGAGIHTLCALLDYCTLEGGLDGYPIMIPGDNLHSHITSHKKIKKEFYTHSMHTVNDHIKYKKFFGWYLLGKGKIKYKRPVDLTLSPISKDEFGRLLIFTMSIGKTLNKKMPPNDDRFDYSKFITLGDKIELVALTISDQLKQTFKQFFGHDFPTYHIDVLWYWNDPDKICTIIEQCGWNPIVDKVHEFCQRVTVFNALYYDTVKRSFDAYYQVLNQQNVQCDLTFYETAMTHALLINHYKCTHPDQIKLIHQLPTSTGDFFNLYNPAPNQ